MKEFRDYFSVQIDVGNRNFAHDRFVLPFGLLKIFVDSDAAFRFYKIFRIGNKFAVVELFGRDVVNAGKIFDSFGEFFKKICITNVI